MFITRKHLSRRTFLRGAGVTIALPFLESMAPAQTPTGDVEGAPPSLLPRRVVAGGGRGGAVQPRGGADHPLPLSRRSDPHTVDERNVIVEIRPPASRMALQPSRPSTPMPVSTTLVAPAP